MRRLAIGARLSTIFLWKYTDFSWKHTVFSWTAGLIVDREVPRPALLLRASYPVFLHPVTQLLWMHAQQRGRTVYARNPPVGRLQGR